MSRYDYHANAVGFGGVLTSANNSRMVIPSLATVALSPTGGEGYAMAENYNANGFAFSRAESRVVGAEVGNRIFTTYAETFITNFTAFDRFNFPRLRIALMGAQVTSSRNLNSDESLFQVRTSFYGVNIDGRDVEPFIDVDLCRTETFGDAVKMLHGPRALTRGGLPETVRGTLVKDWSEKLPAVGPAIHIENYGLVHFAEFIFKPGRRRVNLVRFSLGNDAFEEREQIERAHQRAAAKMRRTIVALEGEGGGGNVIGGAVEGNGSPPTG
jgi:hypothetical protein